MSYQWNPGHFARCETLFADTVNSRGTDITSSGSANTKGSWITAQQSGFAYEYLIAGFNRPAGVDYTVDIGINDGSGNIFVLVPDLRIASRKGGQEEFAFYPLPLHVPSGARLTARCQASTGSSAISMVLNGFSAGPYGAPGFSRAIALYTPTSSRGASIDPGATANTKTRTQLVASSSDRVAAIMCHIGPAGDTARAATSWAMDLECGASSAEQKLVADLVFCTGTTCDVPMSQCKPLIPCDVPAGTRFSANLQCSVTTSGDRVIDLGVWGFVP